MYQSSIKAGYTCKRDFFETNVKPYDAYTSAAFGEECEAKLVIVGDEEWTFKKPKEVKLGGQAHFQIPILQLAHLKSFGNAQNKFSNTGQVRYVDLRDGEQFPRCYRQVEQGEEIGDLQFWTVGRKKFVLKEGYRAWYLNLPDGLKMMSMAEFAAYYDRSTENNATIFELKAGNGYLSTDIKNEHERLLKSDDEANQRETLLPNKILLKDGKTTFRKRSTPVPLQFPVIGLELEYNEKALLSQWTREEQIEHKEACFHVTDIWKYHCGDCGLCKQANNKESGDDGGDEGGDDKGDGGNGNMTPDNDDTVNDDNGPSQSMPDFDLSACVVEMSLARD